MRYLRASEINLVKSPKLRKMVIDAFNRGEKVPYGVIYVDMTPPTKKELEFLKKHVDDLIKRGIIDI